MFSSLLQDLRVSWRTLRTNPGFTLVAVLSLGLGIGANTAIFSVMEALILRSLPVHAPQELVSLSDARSAGLTAGWPEGEARLYSRDFFKYLNDNQKVFAGTAAISSLRVDVHARIGGGALSGVEPLQVRLVSGGYFGMLGVKPAMGRLFDSLDDILTAGHPELVMSHDFWQRRFGADRGVVGKTIAINGTAYTVIGIAAPGFQGTVVGESPDLWAPLSMQRQLQSWINSPNEALTQFLWITARRANGIRNNEAEAHVNLLYRQWLEKVAGSSPSAEQREIIQRAFVKLTDATRGTSQIRRQYTEPLNILLAMVGLVLLIASANVANLLLARISARQREISVRIALGATRGRLISQLLTESVMLALLGGAAGLILAWWAAPVLVSLVSSEPRATVLDVSPQPAVMGFTFALCLLTGILFGIGPALRMTRATEGIELAGLREGKGASSAITSGKAWAGKALVAAQVALAMVLTAGAGWFIQTLHKLRQTDTGFETERVLLVQLDPEASGLDEQAQLRLGQRVEERVSSMPGVSSASYTMVRFDGGRWVTRLWPEGTERTRNNGLSYDGNVVGARYFETMGMQVRQGRVFTPADNPKSEPVAVINEALARRLYPNGDAVGRVIHTREEKPFRIVGVVSNAKLQSVREEATGAFYLYNAQRQNGYQDIVVRSSGNPSELIPRLRAEIQSENPNLAIVEITALGEIVDRSLTEEKMLSKLAFLFGGLALLLSAVGIYGVLAYSVSRRTNEIGVRMAIGAAPGDVLRMVLRESLHVVGLGALVGIPFTLGAAKLVQSKLYGVTAHDPWTIAGALAVMILTASAASLIPSARAARLDPLIALREN